MSDIGQAFSDSLQGLSSAFSGGGGSGVAPAGSAGDLGNAIAQAFTPTPASTPSQTIDPTGSIGAQLAITPPGTSDPTGSIGGTQSGGAPQGATPQGGGGQGGGGGQAQGQSQTGMDQIRQILKQLFGGGAQTNPYQTGAGAGSQQPPWFQPLESGPLPPRSVPAPESAGLPQSPLAPGETWPAEPANVPKSIQPGEEPEEPPGAAMKIPQQQVGGPDLGGLARAVLPRTAAGVAGVPLGAVGALLGSTTPTQAREPGVQPSEAGLAPPGTGPGSYPPSTSYAPGGLPQPPGGATTTQTVAQGLDQETGGTAGMQPGAIPADPKTGLPADPKTGKPVTPDKYKKVYDAKTKPPTKKDQPPPTRQEPPPGGPPPMPPPGGAGLGAILGPLMQSGLPQLAIMALASGMFGGRRRHGGGGGHRFWDDRRHGDFRHGFYPSAHFRPRFYRHDRDEGGFGFNPALLGMMGGPQGPQGGPGQGGPAPMMQRYQPRPGQTTADQTPTSGQIPGVSAQDVDSYVRDQALQMGIDPDVASRLVSGESSFGQNWANPRDTNGYPSYGPFQLNMAPGAMGDQFYRDTGLNPADPKNWQAEVRYALKKAREGGWTPWHTTANNLGYDQWQGINRNWSPAPQDASAGLMG